MHLTVEFYFEGVEHCKGVSTETDLKAPLITGNHSAHMLVMS